MQPGDHPQVAPDTIAALLEAWADHRELAVMPEHDGRGGHPVLVPPTLASMVGEWMGTGGLRRFWREHPECCLRVPVDDPGVVQDLDTPEAYEQARPG